MEGAFRAKNVVVTGGTGALGRAVVQRLIEQGAQVYVPVFHPHEQVDAPKGAQVRFVEGVDLTEESSASTFYSGVPDLWASIHLAGGFAMAPIEETTSDDFMRLMRLNALSCFLSCQAACREIRKTRSGGRIVNVSARPAMVPTPGMTAYAASKAAVLTLTMSLSEELASDGIWVNAVIPSIMDTPVNRQAMPDAEHGMWPTTAQVAGTISFLASPENEVARGAAVPVYGHA